MNKDNRNIYNGYILRENQLTEADGRPAIRPPHATRAPLKTFRTRVPPEDQWPSTAKPIGSGTVIRPPEKKVPQNAAINSALNTEPPADQEAIDQRELQRGRDAVTSIKSPRNTRAPSRSAGGNVPTVSPSPSLPVDDTKSTRPTDPDARPIPAAPIQTTPLPDPITPRQAATTPEPGPGDGMTSPSNSRLTASGTSPTRPDAAELAQMNKDTELAKPMPGNWRNASWSKNSRRMSGNLASNARLKKAAQAEWDKRESRRLEKGGQVAPAKKETRTSNAIGAATPPPPAPPPAKPAAKQPVKNTFGGWLKSLAPGGARPGDNIPGRVKQKRVDPNRPAFTGTDSWKQQKDAKKLDRKTRRATKRANRQRRREARSR